MIKRRNKIFDIVLFVLFLFLLPGCNSSKQNQQQNLVQPPSSKRKANATAQVTYTTASPLVRTEEPLNIKKDPFKPLISVRESTSGKVRTADKNKRVDLLPIQNYESTQFILTGVITGLKENKALLIDPAGKAYVVRNGMLIGDANGRISKITASSIEVTETYIDEKKRAKKRIVVLPLAKKSKEISR